MTAVDVELIAGTGSVSLTTISGFINDVAISGSHADGITLNGNITTAGDSNDSAGGASVDAGGDVVLTGTVFVGTDITIDTDSTGNDGVVTFSWYDKHNQLFYS